MKNGEILAKLFKTLADPNRARIFDLLLTGTHCNCEIAAITELPMNLISHHLKVLSQMGLITSHRKEDDGRWIYYNADEVQIKRLQGYFLDYFDPKRIQERTPQCPPRAATKKRDEDE